MPRCSQKGISCPSSSAENTAPDGLLGLLTMMARVRPVTAFSMSANRGSKLPCRAGTMTGTPPHILTISG